jgi:tetratricopeptide (TPR) repeat protein
MSIMNQFFPILFLGFIAATSLADGFKKTRLSGHELYSQGKIEEAEEAFLEETRIAEKREDPLVLWKTYMGISWYYAVTSRHNEAIEYANRALAIGKSKNEKYLIGRSLCWLGLSYERLGYHEVAKEMFTNALRLSLKDGKPYLIMVWGLAQQELGALAWKTGDIKTARKALTETLDVARSNNILVGIAESGAALAEVALDQGNISEADSLSEEALSAAIEGQCNEYNTARAKLVRGKVLAAHARTPESKRAAKEFLEETVQYGLRTKSIPVAAEAKLLLSNLLREGQVQERRALVEEALSMLDATGDEGRGTARAELGKVLLDDRQTALAEFYIQQGFEINTKLFRERDNAYVTTHRAAASALPGKEKQSLQTLLDAVGRAEATGQKRLLVDTTFQLATQYEQLGYDLLALQSANTAHESLVQLLKPTLPEEERVHLEKLLLGVEESVVRLQLKVGDQTARPSIPE